MAYPYRSILTPIEFDDPSLAALDFARQIATDKGATVHSGFILLSTQNHARPEQ